MPLSLEERRARLRKALRGSGKALRFSEHLEGDGEAIFRHACALGLEGIVSKRRDARYRSGRSPTWLKIKNPTYTGITYEFWRSCDAVADASSYVLFGTPNCGKGEPGQVGHVGHGASGARFRDVQVGVGKW